MNSWQKLYDHFKSGLYKQKHYNLYRSLCILIHAALKKKYPEPDYYIVKKGFNTIMFYIYNNNGEDIIYEI